MIREMFIFPDPSTQTRQRVMMRLKAGTMYGADHGRAVNSSRLEMKCF